MPCLGAYEFSSTRLSAWVNGIVESSVASLAKFKKTYKYVVTGIILQKTGAGLTVTTSCYWDKSMDGSCTVRWENKTIYCILTVFGIAI